MPHLFPTVTCDRDGTKTMLTPHSHNRCQQCGYEFRDTSSVRTSHADATSSYKAAVDERNRRFMTELMTSVGLHGTREGEYVFKQAWEMGEGGGLKKVAQIVLSAVNERSMEAAG